MKKQIIAWTIIVIFYAVLGTIGIIHELHLNIL